MLFEEKAGRGQRADSQAQILFEEKARIFVLPKMLFEEKAGCGQRADAQAHIFFEEKARIF